MQLGVNQLKAWMKSLQTKGDNNTVSMNNNTLGYGRPSVLYNTNDDLAYKMQCRWTRLCAEYGISPQQYPLIITNKCEYRDVLAARLAQLRISSNCNSDTTIDDSDDGSLRTMFTTTMRCHEVNSYVRLTIIGVFAFADEIYPHINGLVSQVDRKLDALEYFMRHEIGHILSWNVMFNGVTVSEFNRQMGTIKSLERSISASWRYGSSNALLNYYELPFERIANEVVGLKSTHLTNADYIIHSR